MVKRTIDDLDVETVAYILEVSDETARLMLAAPALYEALKASKFALDKDSEAIGAAQTSSDIDWFKFGQATALKQGEAIPLIRTALAAAEGRESAHG